MPTRVTAAWRPVLLVVAFALALPPWVPFYPTVDLDASWAQALSRLPTTGVGFGPDFVFTLGPLGPVYTGFYDPGNRWAFLLVALAYAVVAAFITWRLLAPRPGWMTLVAAGVVLAGLVQRDALFLAPPVLWAATVLTQRARPTWRHAAEQAVLSTPVAVIGLVKLSGAPVAVLAWALAVGVLAIRRDPRAALAAAATPVVVSLALWLALGQSLADLPTWVRLSGQIISGYNGAMGRSGPALPVIVYALGALVELAAVGLGRRDQRGRAALVLLLAAALFVSFKAGFVRQDAHVLVSASSFLVLALAAATLLARRAALMTATTGVVVWAVVVGSVTDPAAYVTRGLRTSVVAAPHAAYERVLTPGRLDERYRAAESAIRADPRAPRVPRVGTTDLYVWELAWLFAGGGRWSPRPVPQSYSAYTPTLARLDAAHLEEPGRPDHLLVKLNSIGGRWLQHDDGASWLSMVRWYDTGPRPSPGYARLDARTTPRTVTYGARTTTTVRTGAVAALPSYDGWDGLLATVELAPTLRGRLRAALLRPAPVTITQCTTAGECDTHPFVPALGPVEVVVSPRIAGTADLLALIDPATARHPAQPLASLAVRSGASWAGRVRVSWRPFRVER